MSEFNADELANDETVALLLEEVERLERELRARDEDDSWRADAPHPTPTEAATAFPADPTLLQRVEELSTALAGRDETIDVLLDQARLFEETAEAQRGEWEQLTRWVEEVERRVEDRGGREGGLDEDLAAERRRADQACDRRESESRAWDARRRALEREVADLRARLAAPRDGEGPRHASIALEEENRRLREACSTIEHAAGAAAEVELLRDRLAEALADVGRARVQLGQERDGRAREAKEHDAELAAMKAELARASFQAQPPERPRPGSTESSVQADERIQALRDHLREIHNREAEERASRKLSARLSRLWHHTGPSAKG